jgi:hypothetical protein
MGARHRNPSPSDYQPARPERDDGEPAEPQGTPARDPAAILASYRANLVMARDCTALKVVSLRVGTSHWKTTSGLLRGLQEALELLETEMGA